MSTEVVQLPTIARIPALFGGFTPRQSKFIDNYTGQGADPNLIGNGTKSAIAAGYADNETSAAVEANRLLRTAKIQDEIKRRLGTAICSPSEVLETFSKHARGDLTDLLDKDGNLRFSRAKSKRILKKLKTKRTIRRTKDGEEIEDITHEYEIHDPQKALEKLGSFHRLWSEQAENELNSHSLGDLTTLIASACAAYQQAQENAQRDEKVIEVEVARSSE